jgi:uncharacterized BrkB/YihY/UPF0761 family membrane protein
MGRWIRQLAGALLTAVGLVWLLQGVGWLKGSFMTGSVTWSVIGTVVAVAGVVVLARSTGRGR